MHTLDQLIAFVAVFENGSYSAGARSLNKDRATVREQVMSFEDILGYPLFVINGRKALPTERGQALYHRAKMVVRQNEELIYNGLQYFSQPRTTLTFCHDSLISFEMIKFIELRCATYLPSLQLQWLHRNRQNSLEMLSNSHADIALMANRGAGEAEVAVNYIFLGSVAFNCFVGEHSPLRQLARPSIKELQLELQSMILKRENEIDETLRTEMEAQKEALVAELTQGDVYTKRARPTVVYAGLAIILIKQGRIGVYPEMR